MANRIPREIKQKVLYMWLKAISRAKIARRLGIGDGSVTRIIEDIKSKEIPDIDLLRYVALLIEKEGFELSDVAGGIRISSFLKQIGTTEEEIEKLLKIMEINCFKTEQDFHDFIVAVEAIQDFVVLFGSSIRKIPEFLEEFTNDYCAMKSEEMRRLRNTPKKRADD